MRSAEECDEYGLLDELLAEVGQEAFDASDDEIGPGHMVCDQSGIIYVRYLYSDFSRKLKKL